MVSNRLEAIMKSFLIRFFFVLSISLALTACSNPAQVSTPAASPPSAATTKTGDTTAPAEVTNVSSLNGNTTADIFWTDPADTDLASIEISGTGITTQSVAKGAEAVTLTGLTNGTVYTVNLKAIDKTGNKSAGVTRTLYPVGTNPNAPANVSSLAATAGDGKVILTWSDPYTYRLSSIEISAPGITTVIVAKGLQTATITSLTNGTKYTFTVKAVDTDGYKSAGVTIQAQPVLAGTLVITKRDYTVGSSPYPLTVTATPALAADATLTWTVDDPTIAVVSAAGLVTGLKPGTTQVTVASSDGRKSASQYLIIYTATISLKVWPENFSLQTGQVTLINTVIKGTSFLHWSTSNPAVAKLRSDSFSNVAYIEAVAEGSAVITVTSMDGIQTVDVPVMVGPATHTGSGKWTMTANGPGYALALKEDGSLWSWGKNDVDPNRGTGRNGTYTGLSSNNPLPTKVGNASWKFIGLAAGATGENSTNYCVGIRTDGTLWAWGRDPTFDRLSWSSPIGNVSSDRYVPTQLGTDTTWVKACGSCMCGFGLRSDGSVWGWGNLAPANFNIDSSIDSSATYTFCASPTKLFDGAWKDIFVSGTVTYLVKQSDGSLWSIGYSYFDSKFHTLHQIGSASGFKSIVRPGLALKENGELWGWNLDVYDMDSGDWFGNGGAYYGEIPTRIGTDTWKYVAVGKGGVWGVMAIMGIKTDGTLWAWFGNYYGEFGNGTTSASNASLRTAMKVGSDSGWAFVSGSTEVVAVKNDGSIYTWGSGGKLSGDGTVHLTPTKLPGN